MYSLWWQSILQIKFVILINCNRYWGFFAAIFLFQIGRWRFLNLFRENTSFILCKNNYLHTPSGGILYSYLNISRARIDRPMPPSWIDRLLKNESVKRIDPLCCLINTFTLFLDNTRETYLWSFINVGWGCVCVLQFESSKSGLKIYLGNRSIAVYSSDYGIFFCV